RPPLRRPLLSRRVLIAGTSVPARVCIAQAFPWSEFSVSVHNRADSAPNRGCSAGHVGRPLGRRACAVFRGPEPVGRGPPPAVDRLLASIGLTRPNVSDNNRTLERAQTDVSRPWVRCGGDGAVHPSRRRMLLRCSACA